MKLRSFRNKLLRRFYEDGTTKGLAPGSAKKLRAMFAVLDRMKAVEELKEWPLWQVHTLTGDRKGTWSMNITRNWRLTFRIEADEIVDIDLEDYH